VEDFIMQGGRRDRLHQVARDDGIGRTVRNGLNFTERGFGVSRRGRQSGPRHTAARS